MLQIKALLTNILNNICKRTGFTMTGQLKRADGRVAIGSGQITSDGTLEDFAKKLGLSSGAVGSLVLSTAYTKNNVTITATWYNYAYIPHRSGGLNGAASGDNHLYGTLFLSPMTTNNPPFIIRISSNGGIATIQEVHQVDTTQSTSSKNSYTSVDSTKYTINSSMVVQKNKYTILYLQIKVQSAAQWPNVTVASGFPAPYAGQEVYGCLLSENTSVINSMAVALSSTGTLKCSGGTNSRIYTGTLYYIAA